MKSSIVAYPRIGEQRELKFLIEDYLAGAIPQEELHHKAAELREKQWLRLAASGLDCIPCNDFSFYDGMLDTAVMLNAVPDGFRSLGLDETDTYLAMARGYQGEKGDAQALPMKKWFNTNYHYLVPLLDGHTVFKANAERVLEHYRQALRAGLKTRPVLIGPFTFLKLCEYQGAKHLPDCAAGVTAAYAAIISELNGAGVEWLQLDEPVLVTDMNPGDIKIFTRIYSALLQNKGAVRILLQTYFGDIRDCYAEVGSLGFDGIGLDFVEGRQSLQLVKEQGFPKDTLLFAGLVNGKNIWKNDYAASLAILTELARYVDPDNLVINTSCSLLHVPYSLKGEEKLGAEYKEQLAFAEEKLQELADLKALWAGGDYTGSPVYQENQACLAKKARFGNKSVQEKYNSLSAKDFTRLPSYRERREMQGQLLALPLLPTTTIGSFPQTAEVRSNRARFKRGEISREQYEANVKQKIAECIKQQEAIGLDVLVHGEFERNDMVEYFGENLEGFLLTQNAWVQSYGTRGVKPPVIWGDVSRTRPITAEFIGYAQSLTAQPVKGMLTGPVTILNWSFPREDISMKEMAFQIGLAIREEVLDLEAHGIKIIQIDEAALKEKLPLRRADWYSEYLDWAIPAFRLVHSAVGPATQIHTHMCYSEFEEIIKDIEALDPDVISFEAARSQHAIVDALQANHFAPAVGPGVYDIHSPRIPGVEEIAAAIHARLEKIDREQLWINPDCGLKTRGLEETLPSLQNLVAAAKQMRKELGHGGETL